MARNVEKSQKISTKKITSPKVIDEDISTADDYNKFQTPLSPPKERDKPPIVLRIFKGTSQIITDPGSKEDAREEEGFEETEPCPVVEETKKSPSQSPKLTISTKSLRRKSSESRSPSPEPVPPKHRRNSEKSVSPEEPTRVKRRSPDKSPSPEPTITTRSLRRRGAPESVPQPPQTSPKRVQTSPKRVLRSTRNTAVTTGKIVIANLNSDHPTVYNVPEDGAAAPALPLASPKRKDSKECRSYSNKHKHKKAEPIPKTEDPKKVEVEELLADLGDTPEHQPMETGDEPVPIDPGRQELLQLLEDDEEDAAHNDVSMLEPDQPADLKITPEPEEIPVINPEPELKIKIKMSEIVKPVEPEHLEEPEPVQPIASDSVDSGICVKSEENTPDDDKSQTLELYDSKDSFGFSDNSDFEIKNDSGASAMPAVNKKGSIFKHRGSSDGNKKRLALYKHKWADDKDAANNAEEDKNSAVNKNKVLDSFLDSELEEMPLTKFIRQSNSDNFDFDDAGPVTGVKCPKKNKDVSWPNLLV